MLEIDYMALSATAKEPEKKRAKDAGWDFFADEDVVIGAQARPVRTSIALAIPDGWYGQLQGRSGLASKGIQPRAFVDALTGEVLGGAIDCTYRGEVIVLVANTDCRSTFRINRGDKIAQMMFHEVPDARFRKRASLPDGARGTDGFGSSDGSGSGVTGEHLGLIGDPFKFDDLDGGKAPEPMNLDLWVLDLAWSLYRQRRDYTNKSDVGHVRHVAEMIQRALVAEGAKLNERIKAQRREMWGRDPESWRGRKINDVASFRGQAINRILEHRRATAGIEEGGTKSIAGEEAVKLAADIWGKGHPIVKEVAAMFGVPYPINPERPKAESDLAAERANPPATASAIPPTLNIHTSSKTGPSDPRSSPDVNVNMYGYPFGNYF